MAASWGEPSALALSPLLFSPHRTARPRRRLLHCKQEVYDHVAKPVLFECLKGYSGAILACAQRPAPAPALSAREEGRESVAARAPQQHC